MTVWHEHDVARKPQTILFHLNHTNTVILFEYVDIATNIYAIKAPNRIIFEAISIKHPVLSSVCNAKVGED